MLEQLVDFLMANNKCWEETQNGVLFSDLDFRDKDIKLHHFCSFSIVGVSKYLKGCLNKCVLNQMILSLPIKLKYTMKVLINTRRDPSKHCLSLNLK